MDTHTSPGVLFVRIGHIVHEVLAVHGVHDGTINRVTELRNERAELNFCATQKVKQDAPKPISRTRTETGPAQMWGARLDGSTPSKRS